MPPKKSAPQARAETSRKLDIPDESPLQAVVLADSYNRRFEVLCVDRPRILLPLCSTPLLTWTLEALSLSKVKQVFLFCGVHAEQIREFVEKSPYRHTLDIQCLSSQTARTPGDAMRELDSMGVLNGDSPFILVHSPLVSNYDISKMVDAHKKRREADPNYIMTLGVGQGGRRHPESPIMLIHPPSSRLLHYSPHPLVPSTPRVAFPSHLFTDPFPASIDSYEIWSGPASSSGSSSNGYRDLGVDICELDVPALCTENFDYHDMRRHFVNGVLTSDLLGKKIAVHLIGEGEAGGRYIERVRDTRTYGDITRDVLRRWAFPLVPDLNEPGGVQYELRPGNVYVARDNVMLSRTTELHGPALIGPCSNLQAHTTIHRSTLGSFTSLGPNSSIHHSYIFDQVRIGANCHLKSCIIGRDVEIADGVEIARGALVGDGVKLGKGVKVPAFMRVGRERWVPEGWEEGDEEDEDAETLVARSLQILGDQSLGFIWPSEEEESTSDSDDDEAEDPYEHPRNKSLLQLGRSLSNLTTSSLSLSTLSKASSIPSSPASSASSSDDGDIPSMAMSMMGLGPTATGPSAAFTAEAQLTLERGWEEDYDVVNIGTEMGLLFPAYNAGVDSARKEIVHFILGKISLEGGPAKIVEATTKMFTRWKPIFPKFTLDYVNLVLDMQEYVVEGREEMAGWFGLVLRAGYEADLVDETVLLRWRDDSRAQAEGQEEGAETDKWREVWKKGKVYVDVLEQMESDEEEDSEEEEEEDSDEED